MGLRRVSVHAGTAVADLALPAERSLALLTPLDPRHPGGPRRRRFQPAGGEALPTVPSRRCRFEHIGDLGAKPHPRWLRPGSDPVPYPAARSAQRRCGGGRFGDAGRKGPALDPEPASDPAHGRGRGELPDRNRRAGTDPKRVQRQRHRHHRGYRGAGQRRGPALCGDCTPHVWRGDRRARAERDRHRIRRRSQASWRSLVLPASPTNRRLRRRRLSPRCWRCTYRAAVSSL